MELLKTGRIRYTRLIASESNQQPFLKEGSLPKGTRTVAIVVSSETGVLSQPLGRYTPNEAMKIIEDAFESGKVRYSYYEIVPKN